MTLFEKERYSSRSKMNPIEISDVIEDIKFISLGSEQTKALLQSGYLPFLKPKNDFDGAICYFIKPTIEVVEHMINIGYGAPSGVNYCNITHTISFYSDWGSMTTTPQIAGVLDDDKLQKTLSKVKYSGACQVSYTYAKLYKFEPNYSLKSINITGEKLTKMKTLSRKLWLAAGFMLNNELIVQKTHNGDYDMAFKNLDQMQFLNKTFIFEHPFYLPR